MPKEMAITAFPPGSPTTAEIRQRPQARRSTTFPYRPNDFRRQLLHPLRYSLFHFPSHGAHVILSLQAFNADLLREARAPAGDIFELPNARQIPCSLGIPQCA